MRTTFIVVNYNGEKYIEKCLKSILTQTNKKFCVIVIDNNSRDKSAEIVEKIKDRSSVDMELVKNKENVGFAKAVNMGIELSKTGFIALVNNDAFLKEDWLENMINAAREDIRAGIFASKIYFMNGTLNSAGHTIYRGFAVMERGYFEKDSGQYDLSTYVPGACAAAALYRRKLFEDIGSFDEDYFMYNEDVDLNLRALLMGWKIRYVPKAVAYHIHSASTGFLSDFSVYYNSRNWVWTFIKNVPTPLFWRELPWFILRNITSIAYFCLIGKAKPIIRSKIDAIRGIKLSLKKRKKIQSDIKCRRMEEYINGFKVGAVGKIWLSSRCNKKF